MKMFKYSVKMSSSYFAGDTKYPQRNNLFHLFVIGFSIGVLDAEY